MSESNQLAKKTEAVNELKGRKVKTGTPTLLHTHKNSKLVTSPGQTDYFIPECPTTLKPYVGQLFQTLELSTHFYGGYADICGFDMRHSTVKKAKDGTLLWKYLLCSREGFKNVSPEIVTSEGSTSENIQKRRRVSNRCNCKAGIRLRYAGSAGYIVKAFEEKHTHLMLDDDYKQFAKSNRKIGSIHEEFIMNCVRANVEICRSYKLYKQFVGSYANIGPTLVDFKNYRRSLNSFMVGCDAQMMVDRFFRKKETSDAFCFDYAVDKQDQLCRIFWSDPISRKSFSNFGDVVSADATYNMNRYNMVFVPFTGVDNHKKTITFAVGLLLKEDKDSYVWLFENFKKAMGHEPNILLTDQDPTVKVAFEHVFTTSVHRFCMWHIMFKLPAKVDVDIYNNQTFRKRFNTIVWSNEFKKEEFEEEWRSVVADYNLGDKPWFANMFELRRFWIPSFFDDVNMGGLLRTTSRSESQNNFFSTFIGARSSLVEFLLQYDSAIDAQRHTKLKLDFTTSTCYPSMKTHLPIEKYCASIYTIDVFYDIQEEIFASVYSCTLADLNKVGDVHTYEIESEGRSYSVKYNVVDGDVCCSCKSFMNTGKPCSHMFTVLKNIGCDVLSPTLITKRWTKEATLNKIFEIDGSTYEEFAQQDEKKMLLNELISQMHNCINLVEDDVDGMKELLALMKDHQITYKGKGITEPSASSTKSNFKKLVGPLPTELSVHPPKQAKNKGSRPRRMRSGKEISMEIAKKQQRMCARCNQFGHNIRTCKGSQN